MKKIFKTKFTTSTIVLIPVCIGINYLGRLFVDLLKLPLWLDSIGTCIGACLGGPVIGGICGAANNIIYGLTSGNSVTLIYSLTSLGIGVVVGILARLGFMQSLIKSFVCAVGGGLAAVLISTPLNIAFWGGTTGNIWGDALFGIASANGFHPNICSFLDELVVDVPDKIITIMIVYFIITGLPEKLVAIYDVDDEIESLD